MTIHWKAVEQYLTVVLFVVQFYPVCNFGKCINFGLGTVGSERIKHLNKHLRIRSFGLNTSDIPP